MALCGSAGRIAARARSPENHCKESEKVKHSIRRQGNVGPQQRIQGALAIGCALALAACTTTPPPPQPVFEPLPAPIIIVQPIKPEPPVPVVTPPPVLEPQKVNEEAEEALALLADLQRLVFAGADEQKRELAAASQALSRQRSDSARLRVGLLQSLPGNGADETRALSTLDPLIKQGNGPTRMLATLLVAQLTERQRVLRDERRRAEDLQQKLDALKALERSLLGRERKPNSSP
ncbi:MAG: hypothetical protein ABI831_14085 [Betaproteobacteria bacterium]